MDPAQYGFFRPAATNISRPCFEWETWDQMMLLSLSPHLHTCSSTASHLIGWTRCCSLLILQHEVEAWSAVIGTALKFNRVSDYVPGCYPNSRQGSQYLSRISLAATYSHLFEKGSFELKLLWNINFQITLWPALGRSKRFTMRTNTSWSQQGGKIC